ncbi:MAG: DNA repair protein RecO [Ignavibacteria bacterium]|jgi:DNA repair protein RecO (recombination protein O)
MHEIQKTKAVVLKKIDFGDTSKIATLFTENFGKKSFIVKGARSPKSKIGKLIDPLNHVEVVFYNKENRDVQLITQANLISNFTNTKENLEKIKFATAVIELINSIFHEEYKNELIYRGTVKILELINSGEDEPIFYFSKYFLFFLKEIGYEIQTSNCSRCSSKIEAVNLSFNFETGIICKECSNETLNSTKLSTELFKIILCLSHRNKSITYTNKDLNSILFLLEKYLTYHVPEFSGLKSLHMY